MDVFREVVTKDTVESIDIRGLILNSIDNALIPHNVRLNMFDHDIEDMKKDILKQLLTKIKTNNKMKLHKDDYVLIDTNTKKPIEGFNIVYPLEEVRSFLYEGTYHEEEINEILKKLQSKGECKIDEGWSFVSSTKLPKSLQQKYLDYFKTLDKQLST